MTRLIDEIGFDVVDAGPLADGPRLDPNAAWGPVLDTEELRRSLAQSNASPSPSKATGT